MGDQESKAQARAEESMTPERIKEINAQFEAMRAENFRLKKKVESSQAECERLRAALVMAAEFYKLPGPEFDEKYNIANSDEFVARIDAALKESQ